MYLSCLSVLLLLACSVPGKALPLMNARGADYNSDFNSIVNRLETGLIKYRKELQGELKMADEEITTCPNKTLDDTQAGKRMAEYQKCIESARQVSTKDKELIQNIIDLNLDLIDHLGEVGDNVACPVGFSLQSSDPVSSRIESIKIVDCWKQEISSMKK